jgi:hypothetical protein
MRELQAFRHLPSTTEVVLATSGKDLWRRDYKKIYTSWVEDMTLPMEANVRREA